MKKKTILASAFALASALIYSYHTLPVSNVSDDSEKGSLFTLEYLSTLPASQYTLISGKEGDDNRTAISLSVDSVAGCFNIAASLARTDRDFATSQGFCWGKDGELAATTQSVMRITSITYLKTPT